MHSQVQQVSLKKKQIQQVQCYLTEKQTKQQAQLAVKWHICLLVYTKLLDI